MNTILSLDIETIGHLPGYNPMITLATTAHSPDGKCIKTFNMNLDTQRYFFDVETLEWWKKFPNNFELSTANPQPIKTVMNGWRDFVLSFGKDTVFLGYNSHYDMSFVNHYVRTFCADWERPNLYCIELRDVIAQSLCIDRAKTSKKYWPTEWTSDLGDESNRHLAIWDCLEQAHVYFKFNRS